ncbi:uncharacterized protein LOC112481569 isoform X6 [Pteropus alecto]|uniref:uncharacterized protein LOC112481569 isoform X6 n=1 Tax=Pteropus alecto TaxID=9402 RepID=UPI000D535019|nr:uncharacterized protein LOC112481569 isoform X6 [Pteropus alecto]
MSWKRGCGTSTVTKGRWNALLQGMTRKRAAGCPKPQHPSVEVRSDRNRTHTKAHLLPSPRDKELRTQKEMIQSLSLKSSQCSVAPVKLMANYNIKWMSVPNRNGNSGKSTYPSLSWDRKERNHGVPTERIFREKNRELCLAA